VSGRNRTGDDSHHRPGYRRTDASGFAHAGQRATAPTRALGGTTSHNRIATWVHWHRNLGLIYLMEEKRALTLEKSINATQELSLRAEPSAHSVFFWCSRAKHAGLRVDARSAYLDTDSVEGVDPLPLLSAQRRRHLAAH